jgi:hypothetical protein
MMITAHPDSSSAAAPAPASHPLELLEARQLRDSLKHLLRTEQSAMADFLVALADFDARRGWEALGYASLFSFLHVELRLSNSAAYYRQGAARLLQRFPQLIEPLSDGRLCLSTTGELARVLTTENQAEVAPRFYGLSAREAQEVVAALQPRQVPATRMVVTRLVPQSVAPSTVDDQPKPQLAPMPGFALHPDVVPPTQLQTSGVDFGGGARLVIPRDDVEPLTADLRRLHVTVSRQFLRDLDTARDGLSHAIPNATTEQVLQAALSLLLEKQARARGQVKRPRTALNQSPTVSPNPNPTTAPASTPTEPPPHRRDGPRAAIPASVRRAVWERDAGCCTWPLDGGGRCGSTHRLELDHLDPWARQGEPTVGNLRVVCAAHNRLAARQAFGERWMGRYVGGSDGAGQGMRRAGRV